MNKKPITTFHDPARKWTLHKGDVAAVVPTLPRSTFSGVITDPPYGVGFMEHEWDEAVPKAEVWRRLLSACKPGANLLAFGSPRTFHRLMCNIEDAGWEIRDTLNWVYGEGFPKGLNVGKSMAKRTPESSDSKSWNGYNTALKPAWEPIVLAQKPIRGSYAANAVQFGVAGLNVDECRISSEGSEAGGRYPANLLLDDVAAEQLDRQAGTSKSRRGRVRGAGSNVGNGRTLKPFRSRSDVYQGYDDAGGRSRFFFTAKVSAKERNGSDHPTMKPLALCEYLARLILPPEGPMPRRLLVPFSGVASEMIGGLIAGWDHVTGIEVNGEYIKQARSRLLERSKPVHVSVPVDLPPTTIKIVPSPKLNSVTHGDCAALIPRLADAMVNLVVTSPPYAQQRKKHYPSVPETEYPAWTVRWMDELWNKLTENGSVLIVIDPHVKNGVESDYVERTITALRSRGWKKHPNRIWVKPDRMPLGRTDWPRHAYEHILWFSKSGKPFCDPKAVGPLSTNSSFQNSKFAKSAHGDRKRGGNAKTTDVHVVPIGKNAGNVDHPAKFPQALPEQLIATYCPKGGTVLDPFCGSGTTLLAARKLGRSFYGFDVVEEYCEMSRRRLDDERPSALAG